MSIVICAKNEASNLQKNLPFFFEQDYPEYEVVVVNDCSFDESGDILEEFRLRFPNLHVVTLKEEEIKAHDKKLALTIGIKGARYPRLLLTDADCIPAGSNWIRRMAEGYNNGKEIVIGYGAYAKKSGLLNKLIRFDAFFAALQFLSFARAGKAYMGVGRNLGYTKDLFFRNRGFASQYHIQSGDDDLFINRHISQTPYSVVFHPESFTYSEPKSNLSHWMLQRRRHISTASHYRKPDQIRLFVYQFAVLGFFAMLPLLVLSGIHPGIIFGLFFTRLLFFLLLSGKAMERLNEKDLLLWAPIMELVLIALYPVMFIRNLFNPSLKWK